MELKSQLLENRRQRKRISTSQFSRFFPLFLCCLTFYLMIDDVFREHNAKYGTSELFTFILLVSMNLFFLLQVWRDKVSFSHFGFTTVNIQYTIIDTLKSTTIVLVVMSLAKCLWVYTFASAPVFSQVIDFSRIFSLNYYLNDMTWMIIYFLGIPLQEIVSRGMLQNYFTDILVGKGYAWSGNIIATCFFVIFHSHVSQQLPVFVFPLSLFWGWLYMRHKNLFGCTLSHLIVSFWGYYILNLSQG